MGENLYPHEICVEILSKPNTLSESLMWLLFSGAMMIIQMFVVYGFIAISTLLHKPLDAIDAIYGLSTGLNVCAYLTLVLFVVGIIGIISALKECDCNDR